MEFYERVSGARMHAAFHKPMNIFSSNIDLELLSDINYFINSCFITLNEMHNVLSYNKIWKQRLLNIGTVNTGIVQQFNLSGVMARSAGVKRDIRLSPQLTYSNYNLFQFKSYFGVNGDCYDRFLIRMLEMGESLNISNQTISKLRNVSTLSATSSTSL
jgi:NADH:ubiquinone oxidoreductase subunit D